MPDRILVVDDERLTRETLGERLKDEKFDVAVAGNAYEALELTDDREFDLIITDLRMPSMNGLEFQRRLRAKFPEVAVIFMTAFGTVDSAVEAMREGAADYLTKPLNTEELLIRIRRVIQRQRDVEEIRLLRMDAARHRSFGDMVYRSGLMTLVVERAIAIADTDIAVLIQGETGTGKEILARAIHAHSMRSTGPFVAVNCAGLNPNLVESELFGHEKGAFTGANRMRKGRLEMADGGTLLIDEVDDLPPGIQVQLLRFLQDHAFERVGSSRTVRSDARVVCATKRDLKELVAQGAFREDLYYRINTVVIELPPLRDRREDIVPLAELFLAEACGTDGQNTPVPLAPETLKLVQGYDWPGNVRELKHAVEHAVAFARCGPIEPQHLPAELADSRPAPVLELSLANRDRVSFTDVMKECEGQLIDWALSRSGGNQGEAAERLSLPRTTLRSRLATLRETDPPALSE